MRFLRGIGVGILGFFLFIIAGFVVIGNTIGFINNGDFDFSIAMEETPIWTVLMLVGFIGMIFGPIYYWLIEPLLQKRKNKDIINDL